MTETPFAPAYGTNQVTAPNVASASVDVDYNAKSLRLVNDGTTTVYIHVGNNSVTATTADMPLLSDDSIIVYKGYGPDKVAFISPGGAGILCVQTGEGGY